LGFFLTVLYMLVVFIRPQEFVEEIKAWPIIDVLAVLCLGAVFIEGRINLARLGRSNTSKLFLLFFIWTGLSHLGFLNTHLILDTWLNFAPAAIVYYLIILNVDTIQRLKLFIWILILAVTVLALQAIWQFYSGSSFGGAEAVIRGEIIQVRGIGVFADPNDLGLHLVTLMPFMLPSFHRPFLSPSIWTGLLLLVPVVTGLAFTRSRGSLLGVLAVFWFYFYKRVGLITSMITLAVLFAFFLTIPRMDTINTQENSARQRMEQWSKGFNLFKWKPITGVGFYQYVKHEYRVTHNTFVQVFAELGIVGAYLWLGMFFSAWRDLYFVSKDPRPPPEMHRFGEGLLGAMLGWQVCAFFLSHAHKFLSFVLLALAVSLLTALDNIGIYVDNPWTGRQTTQTMFITIGAFTGFYILLRTLWNV
jgi:putative inorganic carbon (HCO3(-)) transporter